MRVRRAGGERVGRAEQDVGRLDVAVDDLFPLGERLGRVLVSEGLVGEGVGERVPDVPDAVRRQDDAVGSEAGQSMDFPGGGGGEDKTSPRVRPQPRCYPRPDRDRGGHLQPRGLRARCVQIPRAHRSFGPSQGGCRGALDALPREVVRPGLREHPAASSCHGSAAAELSRRSFLGLRFSGLAHRSDRGNRGL